MKVTEHFDSDEFACRDGSPYPAEWIVERLSILCATLEVIRTAAGNVPIRVNSGYRTLEYNRKLGSHDTSQHPKGRAADIQHPKLTADELYVLVGRLYVAGRLPSLGGLGKYPTFIHVDVRPRPEDDHLALWTGGRMSNVA
jgi:uncharacterized protein YcbK (DUF882 family)